MLSHRIPGEWKIVQLTACLMACAALFVTAGKHLLLVANWLNEAWLRTLVLPPLSKQQRLCSLHSRCTRAVAFNSLNG